VALTYRESLTPREQGRRGTRVPRWLVLAVALLLVAPALTSATFSRSATPQLFPTRPDLRPPVVDVLAGPRHTAPGYFFLAPKGDAEMSGPMIIDSAGRLVWHKQVPRATDFKVEHYRGQPVLTWWEGTGPRGHGAGVYVLVDRSYRRIGTVRAGNGLAADLHDLEITDRGTALLLAYHEVPVDVAELGLLPGTNVHEGVVQEVDIRTGEVLFEWHSLDHVSLAESYRPVPTERGKTYDYFHINSVSVDRDDNLLVSARHTQTVYKIDRQTGDGLWRLGGKRSDFTFGPGARFGWQHDAQRQPDGTISLFDNAAVDEGAGVASRALVLDVDTSTWTATLVRAFTSPEGLLSTSQANHQILPGGHQVVGWGSQPYLTEFGPDGRVLFHATFGSGMDSYRAFKFRWTGRPRTDPAVAVQRHGDDEVTVVASWNGATEVVGWTLLAGPDAAHLTPVGSAPRTGFETAIRVTITEPLIAVQARDEQGSVLATSRAVPL
jgi:hypothetical protein